MASFISGALLKEKPCCKFVLKHDIKNYVQQFTKTLSICFQWSTTLTDLLLCHYFWLEQLMSVLNMEFFRINPLILLEKIRKIYISCLKSKTGCYDINVTFTGSPKTGFPVRLQFFLHLKKI